MRRLALFCAVCVLAACGEHSPVAKRPATAEAQVRAAAQRYLDALARGDAETACGMLSDSGIDDAGYGSRRDCVRDYNANGKFPSFPIVSVKMRSESEADVIIGDAAASDSGNDAVSLKRYPTGWLVDVG
jgi:hypothetical protein